jgi:hypothetical protein
MISQMLFSFARKLALTFLALVKIALVSAIRVLVLLTTELKAFGT